jgi:hypothetical protein
MAAASFLGDAARVAKHAIVVVDALVADGAGVVAPALALALTVAEPVAIACHMSKAKRLCIEAFRRVVIDVAHLATHLWARSREAVQALDGSFRYAQERHGLQIYLHFACNAVATIRQQKFRGALEICGCSICVALPSVFHKATSPKAPAYDFTSSRQITLAPVSCRDISVVAGKAFHTIEGERTRISLFRCQDGIAELWLAS